MKRLILLLMGTVFNIGTAQMVLNDYKFIIVPKRFSDFKKENQYQTSTLVKHLFTQKGFQVFYDDNLPMDLNSDRCLGLLVKLNNNSSLFTTKVNLDLVDCFSKTVYSTQEGRSKEKEYKISFNEAIRESLRSLDGFQYTYNGKVENREPITVSFRNDVKHVETDMQNKAAVNERKPTVRQEATPENQLYTDVAPVQSNIKKGGDMPGKTVEQVATPEERTYTNRAPVPSTMVKQETKGDDIVSEIPGLQGLLYAQELDNGYQLVDSTPSIVMKLLHSSLPEVYHAKFGNSGGMVYKKGSKWYFEYYSLGKLRVQELNIKF
ncbi:MAG: hypothetical protein AAGA86_10175 [Bacteroidota bacterium]